MSFLKLTDGAVVASISSRFNFISGRQSLRPAFTRIVVIGLLLFAIVGGACTGTQIAEPLQDAVAKEATQQGAAGHYDWKGNFSFLVAEIRNDFPAAFSGAEIVDAGHAWISFAGSAPDGALAAIDIFVSNNSGVSIDVRTGQKFTEVELQRAISEAHYAVLEMTEVSDAITRFDSAQKRITTTVALVGTVSDSVLDELQVVGEMAITGATHPEFIGNIAYSVIHSDSQSSIVLE